MNFPPCRMMGAEEFLLSKNRLNFVGKDEKGRSARNSIDIKQKYFYTESTNNEMVKYAQ